MNNAATKAETINAFCTVVRTRGATIHSAGKFGAVIACDSEAQAADVAKVAAKRSLTAEVQGLDVFVS
jgi:hypothetical protein